jgi:metal-sulfur cluster biosynthetic enzyme
MLTEETIREALRDCYHPELPCNIIDLGLVYAVDIAPDPDAPGAGIPGVPARHRVHVSLTLTAPQDPTSPEPNSHAAGQLTAQIQGRLAAFETVRRTEVTLVWQPPWTPNRISPEGRRRLGLSRQQSALVQIEGIENRNAKA